MSKIVRVLHIFSGYGGGVSSLIKNLVKNKDENCTFDTMAFSYHNGESFVNLIQSLGGHTLIIPRLRSDGIHVFYSYIQDNVTSEKYDIVYCHLSSFTALPFLLVCKRNGIKNVIIHAHSTVQDSWWDRLPVLYQIGQVINYHYSKYYFTCSDLAANYVFGKRYVNRRKVFLIPNGIDESAFSKEINCIERARYYDELNIDPGSLVLLHMGRFNKQKNHIFLLKIISDLKQQGENIKLLLAGEGELQGEIRNLVDELQLENEVCFLNRRNDVSTLMQFADCVLLPSLNEGLPTVAIECQAAGTPLLLSDSITRQCDMSLGLLHFLPIDDARIWATCVMKINEKKSVVQCVETIRQKGFTGKEAGKRYCKLLNEIIK